MPLTPAHIQPAFRGANFTFTKLLLMIAIVLTIPLAVSASIRAEGEYASIVTMEAPAVAIPNQRVIVHLKVAYSFFSKAQIGISVNMACECEEGPLALSGGGSIDPAMGQPGTGTRDYYMAVTMPSIAGANLPLEVTVTYSHGAFWLRSDNSSEDFAISVSDSNGFTVPSNVFNGSATIRSNNASEPSLPAYTEIHSLSATRAMDGLIFSLSIAGTAHDAQTNGLLYVLGIDTTNKGASVSNGTINYLIPIIAGEPATANLETSDGRTLKGLDVTTSPNGYNSYNVSGLSANDIGGQYSFNMLAAAFRPEKGTDSNCASAPSISTLLENPDNLGSCARFGSSTFEFLGVAPAGGWAPISIPVELSVSTPTSIRLDGTKLVSINGHIHISVPAGTHQISVPSIVEINETNRLRFDHWKDGLNNSERTEMLQTDSALDPVYVTQYRLTINSPVSTVTGDGWYDAGSTATFQIAPRTPVMSGPFQMIGGKWRFQGWYENGKLISVAPAASIIMNKPSTIVARWAADYTTCLLIAAVAAIAITAFLAYIRRRKKIVNGRADPYGGLLSF